MPNVARAHHFVPDFLLAGFTPAGSKDDFLWASDLQTGKQWNTKPKNVAHRRDFYRVDVPGLDPNAIESGLSTIEGQASGVISEVLKTHAMPSGDDYLILMNFLALMHVRVPRARDSMNQSVDIVSKHLLKTDLRDQSTWKARVEAACEARPDIGEAPSYDCMKAALEESRYSFVAEQNWHIRSMLELMERLTPCFTARAWCLAISNSGGFISSDCPVSVSFTTQKAAMDSPALMREDTEITFPLSRNVLLVGSWERFAFEKMGFDQRYIALCNSITARRSQRFLFSSTKDFCWLDDKGNVRYELGPLARSAAGK